jgi:hypothetical protein
VTGTTKEIWRDWSPQGLDHLDRMILVETGRVNMQAMKARERLGLDPRPFATEPQ